MKLEKLHLKAFGNFTDTTLDFTSKDYGLHVVFGANETGKSTALRALTTLLYGFGHTTTESWLHANKDLTISGDFRLQDNTTLSISRYKRRKNDLIDTKNDLPFAQGTLENLLGRMSKETFQHTFAISHESLRLGVESVLAAGGDLSQALFAATSGLNTLKKVMTTIETEQNNLFLPRATKAQINASLTELRKLRKRQASSSTSHRQWEILHQKIIDLHKRERIIEKELEQLSIQQNLLSRYKASLPHVAKWKELRKQHDQLRPTPDLREDFTQARIETQVNHEQAKQNLLQLRHSLDITNKKFEELKYDQKIIDNELLIENLAADANIHAKAKIDAKSLRAKIYKLKEKSEKELSLIRPGLTLREVESLRLSRAEYTKIQRLASSGIKLQETLTATRRMYSSAKENHKHLQIEFSKYEKTPSRDHLAASISRAGERGKLHELHKKAQSEYTLLQQLIEMDLAALGIWQGKIEDLLRLPLPSTETLQMMASLYSDIKLTLKALEEKQTSLTLKKRNVEKSLTELTRVKSLPTITTLQEHRLIRDHGWLSIKSVWLHNGTILPEFADHVTNESDLAESFEYCVKQVDETSDLLRNDAETIARVEVLQNELSDLTIEIKELETSQKKYFEQQEKTDEQWHSIWEPSKILPHSPSEMLAWLRKVDALKLKAIEAKKISSTITGLESDIVEVSKDIKTALLHTNVSIPKNLHYDSLLELAKQSLSNLDNLQQKRDSQQTRMETISLEIRKNKIQISEIETELEHWNKQWLPSLSKLGLPHETPIQDVQEFILLLDDIFKDIDKTTDLQERNEALLGEYKKYASRVSEVLAVIAPDLTDMKPEEAAFKLKVVLSHHKESQRSSLLLLAEKHKTQTSIDTITAQLKAIEKTMELLCGEANTDNEEILPEIESQFRLKTNALQNLDKVTEIITELAAGQEVETFVEEVEQQDHDLLMVELEQVTHQQKSAQEELKQLVAVAAVAKEELSCLDNEAEALYIAEKAEGIITETQAKVEHYLKLKVASAVLKQSIERYRQSNQSPVLHAASSFFQKITENSFSGLQADYDEKGSPVLKAKRNDDSLLTIDELSDGSRDQLFLALRFGGLTRYVSNNGPMFFVVDDILVHFDDQRSIATLHAMAKLSKHTQIIFFTHHQHLLNIIEMKIQDKSIHIHYL